MKYAKHYHIIKQALEGLITCEEGAKILNISTRHFKRLKSKVKISGPKALIHGNRGRKPPNSYPDEIRQKVLLFQTRYSNFNVSHFTDMLKDEHGLSISRETVRSWLKEAGLLKSPKRRFKRRKRRKRAPREGQIVLLDGSLHYWFGNKQYTLLLALDDATGKALYALFVPRETLRGYFRLTYKLFSRYGLPQNFYIDRHCVFITTRHEGVHVKQSADNPTSFQIAMAELEIGLIYAYSPQAKGRIERSIRTFQDRLVKELALKEISDPEKATLYTNEVFIPRYNRKFAVEAEEKEKAWRKPPKNLKEILSRRMSRKVKADLTISVEGRVLQLKLPRLTMRLSGTRVEVRELFDGSFRVYHNAGEIIPHEEIKRDKRSCRKKIFRIKKKTYQGGDIFPLQ